MVGAAVVRTFCKWCKEEKPVEQFPVRNDRSGRLRPYCYSCVNQISRARYEVHRQESPFKLKCSRTRTRAKSLGLDFNLTPEYLESIWTGVCPVLNDTIYLSERSRTDEFVAELDRFIPSKGYIIGNVHFLSRKANRLKNNVTTKELQQLINWMNNIENSQTKC